MEEGMNRMAYRLMICEDEPLEREVLASFIVKSGLPVEIAGEARNGLEAVAIALETRPDIVLMDIMMPGMDGLKATARIREKDNRTKVVIITAYDEFNYAKEALQLGVVDYLLKPVRPADLLAVIRKIVGDLDREREREIKEQKLRETIKKAARVLRSEFMAGLLSGAFDDEKVIEAQAVLLGIEQLPDGILVIEPDMETTDVDNVLGRYEVYNLAEQTVASFCSDCMVALMGEQIVVGVCPQQDLKELAERLRADAAKELDYTVTIGLGRASGRNLGLLYRDVQTTTRLGKFYFGGNCIVSRDDMEKMLGPDDTSTLSFDKEERLVEQVRLGQKKEALKILEELLQEMVGHSRGSVSLCQMRMAEILVLICWTAKQAGFIEKTNYQVQQKYLRKLGRCKTLEELGKWCRSLFDEILGSMEERSPKNLIQSVIKYINENYASELNLQRVARQIYLSPDYFGKLFKKEAGCTYVEYLTRVRIDAAKQLLTNTRLSVAEIAFKVGYSDPNYFSRVFHKEVGLSPTNYREILGFTPENSRV